MTKSVHKGEPKWNFKVFRVVWPIFAAGAVVIGTYFTILYLGRGK